MIKIALDAMGGDFAPSSTVQGAVEAIKENSDIKIILVGNEEKINEELRKYSYDKEKIEIIHTDEEILMKESMPPALAVRKKKKASMNIAVQLVKDGKANAVVSAGNTGALMTASQLTLKRIKGVLRPAITTIFPKKNGKMVMMDVGANADCKPEYLEQFCIMGMEYAKILLEIKNPKVALLNIGEEEGKGNELVKQSYELIKSNSNINFIGNIESREMLTEGKADVVVADGFTGNIVLKTAEGVAKTIFDILKEEIETNFLYKLAALILKPVFKTVKNSLDSSEYGGALFLGLNGISIKAHGNSNGKAIKNALNVAKKFAESNFIENIKESIDKKERVGGLK
ncbi:phosphate:acyl-[acyl carrier protein] acyltransferase [Hypnocyclicus thermotrophus]|uniref:Phosphate acyltransferase n=1 Tax=Hypnocyclicus thermotrophus TaxID=1627895 RepID=A0AA46DYF5_9FUSO|nr:phosphate:acyl-[acyl carrier protein] acyltransferase [Hypnocyclicus thermotrophus]